MILDEPEEINELDPQGMVEDLDTFPEQCREAVSIGRDKDLPFDLSGFDRIVVTGMGGSAIVGDILSRLIDLPVTTNRGYYLPDSVDESDLLLAISYSGNTEETLSALRDGLRRGMSSVCLSTGGKMEDFAGNGRYRWLKFQPDTSPGPLRVTCCFRCSSCSPRQEWSERSTSRLC